MPTRPEPVSLTRRAIPVARESVSMGVKPEVEAEWAVSLAGRVIFLARWGHILGWMDCILGWAA